MKKFYALFFAVLFGATAMTAQNVYFTEDFESGLPMDWTIDGEWQLTDAAGIASDFFMPGDHTMFLGFNDDAVVNGTEESGRVLTGPIDLTDVTGITIITFQSFFINGDYGGDETGRISISNDDGATWTEILNLEVSGGEWLQASAVIDASYAGQTVRFAFDYDDGAAWNYGWCIDDISIEDPSIVRDLSFDDHNKEAFFSGAFVGAEIYPGGIVTNNGIEEVTSFDMNVTVNGTTTTETISGLGISALGGKGFAQVTTPYIMEDGSADISVSISNVNGMGDDDDTTNDAGDDYAVTSVTPHPDRGVVVEEATGTWCTWCPRGTVYLDGMTQRYPGQFVGIAVHNNDPMAFAEYDGGVTSFPGFTGFPSVIFDRETILDPSAIEGPFLGKITNAPVAKLNLGATYDDATRELTVSVDALFNETVPDGYRLNAVIIEDGLSGTSADWAQVNAYSGGGPGIMDIFTILPSPVPGDMLVYDHVGRALLGGFAGLVDGLEGGADAGQNLGNTFATYTIPSDFNTDHVHIVAMLIANDGSIENAIVSTIDEAVTNGLFTSAEEVFNHDLISVSPNPFADVTNIKLNIEGSSEVGLQVFNAVGQLVAERDYGTLSGTHVLPFNAADMSEGMYYFHVRIDDQIATQRVNLVR